jgi:hypothetical protein
MSIVASVKVYDGIVLGADSATTIQSVINGQLSIIKSYQHAKKVFQIGNDLRVGVLIYGLGNIGKRSIESFIFDFNNEKKSELTNETSVEQICVMFKDYIKTFYDAAFGQLPITQQPALGFYFAGYSDDDKLAKEWEIVFPNSIIPKSVRGDLDCGASWRGMGDPFSREYFGFDNRLINELATRFNITDQVALKEVLNKYQLQVVYDGMPLQDAIDFVKYILSTTIGFSKYQIGVPVCGEPVDIIVITREGYDSVKIKEFKV